MSLDTNSTADVLELVRDRILNFAPIVGDPLETAIDGRLYQVQAPDNSAFPHGVMRFINRVGNGDARRENVDLEVMLFDRPRTRAKNLEDVADLFDQAMVGWVASSSGLVFSRGTRSRDTLPPFADPADREVVQIRLIYPLTMYVNYLTQYS